MALAAAQHTWKVRSCSRVAVLSTSDANDADDETVAKLRGARFLSTLFRYNFGGKQVDEDPQLH